MVQIAGAIGLRLGQFLASRVGQALFGSKLRAAVTLGVGYVAGKKLLSGNEVSKYRGASSSW